MAASTSVGARSITLLRKRRTAASAGRDDARRCARAVRASALYRAAEQAGVYEAALYSHVRRRAGRRRDRSTSTRDARAAARGGRSAARGCSRRTPKSRQAADAGLVLRVVVPVNSGRSARSAARAAGDRACAERAARRIVEKVQAGARDYQEISFSRERR